MAISLGVFTYYNKNKNRQSTNIGDQVQTLAQINIYRQIVSDFYKKEISFLDFVDNIFENSYPDFDFIFLPRDNLSEAEKYNKNIYVIMNGWFMHLSEGEEVDWPPPNNIIPIFISFHVANDDLLDEKYIEYYKKHEPIGCRDLSTKKRFAKIGVKAYFSGCLTLTGDYLKWSGEKNNGKTCVIDVDVEGLQDLGDYVCFGHKYSEFNNYKESILYAYNRLMEYCEYKEVITSRLHAYLPCLAMGVPVRFIAPNGNIDRRQWGSKGRFDGLRRLGLGTKQAEVGLNTLQKRLNALSRRVINKILFSPPQKSREDDAGRYDLVFCCDSAYVPMFLTVLNSIFQNNLKNLFNIHLIHNDINKLSLEKLKSFVKFKFNNMNIKTYKKAFKHEYNAVGGNMYAHNKKCHISEATMLRLYIPELLKDQKKVLYLDCDLIVKMNLEDIFNTDTGPRGLALKSSYVDNFLPYKFRKKIRRSGNAGVILMDLEVLRENNFTEYCINLNSEQPFNDQILINVYANGEYSELHDRFNVFATQDNWLVSKYDDYILHYVSRRKPWAKLRYFKKQATSSKYYRNLSVSPQRLLADWEMYDLAREWKKYKWK